MAYLSEAVRPWCARFNVLRSSVISLLFITTAGMSFAAEPVLLDQIRSLNNRVLGAHAVQRRTVNRENRATSRADMAPVFAERAAALSRLIERDPTAALTVAFSDEARAELLKTFPEAATALESNGEWSGEVEYSIGDDENLATAEVRTRLTVGSEVVDVHFAGAEPEDLESGRILTVKGVRLNGRVAAGTSEVTSSGSGQALPCVPTGEQKIAVMLVTYPGVAAPTLTKQQVADALWGATGQTLDGFWREGSYDKASASGDVFGWYTLDKTYSCKDLAGLRSAAIRAAGAEVNWGAYNRVFVISPPPSGCNYAGYSSIGCSSFTAGGTSNSASTSWMRSNYFTNRVQAVEISSHEAGHAIGLRHARSRDFGTAPLGAIGTAGTINEYGDTLSTMGTWDLGHYTAKHKSQIGWQSGASVQTVQSSGTFTIAPTEVATTGPQTLKVQRGTGNNAWLWIEYRQPIGLFDNTLPSTAFSGALIHYEDPSTGSFTDLLDFTPETGGFTDAPLADGKTWVDPYSNLSLSVSGKSPTGLTVKVEYGAAPCVRANPTVSMSPANPSASPGQTVVYTVSLKNNDSSSCSSTAFQLNSGTPAGWPNVFSAGMTTLAPGQSGTVTMTKTVPSDATPATYAVNATVADTTRTISAAASCTVMLAPAQSALSAVSVSPVTLMSGTSSTSNVVTLTGPAPAAGAVVTLTSSTPSVSVPATVTVPAGTTSANFTSIAANVSTNASATITALYDGVSRSGSVSVTAATSNGTPMSAVYANPASVTGGTSSTGSKVWLAAAAPAGGTVVTLSSSSSIATVPATVTVPAGLTYANFNVATSIVSANTSVTITATSGGVSRTTVLTVLPPAASSLFLRSVVGGGTSWDNLVYLTGPAPAGGAVVSITASAGVVVPATVTVPAGATSVKFPITSSAVSTSTTYTISATYGGATKSGALTITP